MGYASEVAQLLTRIGFEHFELERLAATCDPENAASVRVLEKAGFEREGLLRGHVLAHGRRRDSLIFGMLNTDIHPTTGILRIATRRRPQHIWQ